MRAAELLNHVMLVLLALTVLAFGAWGLVASPDLWRENWWAFLAVMLGAVRIVWGGVERVLRRRGE